MSPCWPEPLLDYGGKLDLGSELVVTFDQIRDHVSRKEEAR